LYDLIGWAAEVTGLGVKSDLLVQIITHCPLLVVEGLIPDGGRSLDCCRFIKSALEQFSE